jgi:hypothetical protein
MMNIENVKATLQMVGSRIVSLDIKNMFVFLENTDKGIERAIDVSYEVGDPFESEGGNGELMCLIRLNIEIKIKKEIQEANITLVTEGGFASNTHNKEELKEMTAVNGAAAIYSVARGTIASITGQMCEGGQVLIPMLNIYEMNKSKKK